MPIDPSIYSQLQPNLAMGMGDIVNRYVDQTQADAYRRNRLSQLAQAGELQAMQLQQAKQQAADEAAVRQAYKESGGDIEGLAQKLYAQGLPTQAAQLIKSQTEQQRAGLETGLKRHEAITALAGDIAQNPAQWAALVDNAEKTRAILPADAQVIRQQYMSMPVDQIGVHALQGSIAAKDKSAKLAEVMYPKPIAPSWQKIEEGGRQILINANEPSQRFVFGPAPKSATFGQEPPPKAAPGTRVYRDAEGNWQTEILKGSPQWQTQKSKEATDRAFVQNTVPTFEKNIKDIQDLVTHKGFENIFGRIGGIESLDIMKDTREARAKLDQVVGAMETSGYNLMKSTSGSAGSMSQQEWPKMQTYFNIIKTSSDPKQVKEAMEGAVESYRRMQDIAKESYMNEWGTGQFGDPKVIERLNAATEKPKQTTKSGATVSGW